MRAVSRTLTLSGHMFSRIMVPLIAMIVFLCVLPTEAFSDSCFSDVEADAWLVLPEYEELLKRDVSHSITGDESNSAQVVEAELVLKVAPSEFKAWAERCSLEFYSTENVNEFHWDSYDGGGNVVYDEAEGILKISVERTIYPEITGFEIGKKIIISLMYVLSIALFVYWLLIVRQKKQLAHFVVSVGIAPLSITLMLAAGRGEYLPSLSHYHSTIQLTPHIALSIIGMLVAYRGIKLFSGFKKYRILLGISFIQNLAFLAMFIHMTYIMWGEH